MNANTPAIKGNLVKTDRQTSTKRAHFSAPTAAAIALVLGLSAFAAVNCLDGADSNIGQSSLPGTPGLRYNNDTNTERFLQDNLTAAPLTTTLDPNATDVNATDVNVTDVAGGTFVATGVGVLTNAPITAAPITAAPITSPPVPPPTSPPVTTPPPGTCPMMAYSAADLALHNNENDCLMSIYGVVYDLTWYIDEHKGGRGTILMQCGTDATFNFVAEKKHDVDMLVKKGFVPSIVGRTTEGASGQVFVACEEVELPAVSGF